MKRLACGAIVPGCAAVLEAESEETLLAKVGEHAAKAHGLDELSADLREQVRANIVDV